MNILITLYVHNHHQYLQIYLNNLGYKIQHLNVQCFMKTTVDRKHISDRKLSQSTNFVKTGKL